MNAADGAVRIWSVAGAVPEPVTQLKPCPAHGLLLSPDGCRLVAALTNEAVLRLYYLDQPDAAPVLLPVERGAGDLVPSPRSWCFSRDGKRLATVFTQTGYLVHSAQVWDLASGDPRPLPRYRFDPKQVVKWRGWQLLDTADGRISLLAYGDSRTEILTDITGPAGNQTTLLNHHVNIDQRWPVTMSGNGRTVATLGNNGRLLAYDRLSHDLYLDTELFLTDGVVLQLTDDGRGQAVTFPNGVVYLLRVPATAAAPRPLDAGWLKRTQALPAAAQVEAVDAELTRRNPWYAGKATASYLDGAVVGLKLVTDELTDLSPLRALTALKTLSLRGSAPGKSRVRDLSPLKDLPLQHLQYDFHGKEDRAQVQAMKPLQMINGQDVAAFWKGAEGN
jgi:hypothetical protein